jgi:uncharacterized membrane protein
VSRSSSFRRLATVFLLLLVLTAIIGHVFLETADMARGNSAKTAGLAPASGCLHTGIALLVLLALPLVLTLRFALVVSVPLLRGYCPPTPQHPPVSVPAH